MNSTVLLFLKFIQITNYNLYNLSEWIRFIQVRNDTYIICIYVRTSL